MTMQEPRKVTLYWPKGLHFWWPRAKYAEGYLLDGKRHGRWVFWYRSGQKQLEGEYIKGIKTAIWVKWGEAGEKTTEGEFLYGKMNGRWIDWHKRGQKALESKWAMGKRDGKWTYWRVDGSLEKTEVYDHHFEEDRQYSIHTDLEEKEIVRKIHRENMQQHWERLVGKLVASLIKPWHLACWIVIFVPIFGLMKARTPWRGAALAGLLAILITSLLAWGFDRRRAE